MKRGKIELCKPYTVTPITIGDVFLENSAWGKVPNKKTIAFKKGIFGNEDYDPEKHFIDHYFHNALKERFPLAEVAELMTNWFDDEGNELDDWRITFSLVTARPFNPNGNSTNSVADMLQGVEDCLKNALIALKRDTKK